MKTPPYPMGIRGRFRMGRGLKSGPRFQDRLAQKRWMRSHALIKLALSVA